MLSIYPFTALCGGDWSELAPTDARNCQPFAGALGTQWSLTDSSGPFIGHTTRLSLLNINNTSLQKPLSTNPHTQEAGRHAITIVLSDATKGTYLVRLGRSDAIVAPPLKKIL